MDEDVVAAMHRNRDREPIPNHRADVRFYPMRIPNIMYTTRTQPPKKAAGAKKGTMKKVRMYRA